MYEGLGKKPIKVIIVIGEFVMTVDSYACDGVGSARIGVDIRISIIIANFGDCSEAIFGIVCVGNGERCGCTTVEHRLRNLPE